MEFVVTAIGMLNALIAEDPKRSIELGEVVDLLQEGIKVLDKPVALSKVESTSAQVKQ